MPNQLFETPLSVLESLHFPAFLLTCDDGGKFFLTEYNQLSRTHFFCDVEFISGSEITRIFPNAEGLLFQQKLEDSRVADQAMSFKFSVHRTHYDMQFQVDLQPLKHGSVMYFLVTAIDITEARAALIESTKMAHLINEMESYMAHAAYQLQDPIKHLSSLSQELKNNFKDLGDGKLKLLDQVEELSNATLAMIREVLDQSRAINPITSSVPRYDLKHLCTDVLAVFNPLQQHKLQMDTAWVEGESLAMRVAIATLIENAIRHNPDQALLISIAVRASAQDGQVDVTVHDNGKGFANAANDANTQHASDKNPVLNIIELYKYIAEHGGKVKPAEPSQNSGAAVSFSLPGSLIERSPKIQSLVSVA